MLKDYTEPDKHGCTDINTVLHVKLPASSHSVLLEVKVNGGTESCATTKSLQGDIFQQPHH